jgi:hypothetical protein
VSGSSPEALQYDTKIDELLSDQSRLKELRSQENKMKTLDGGLQKALLKVLRRAKKQKVASK